MACVWTKISTTQFLLSMGRFCEQLIKAPKAHLIAPDIKSIDQRLVNQKRQVFIGQNMSEKDYINVYKAKIK